MNRFLSKNKNINIKKNIEKMDFPELVLSKKKPIIQNEASYKNMVNKEVEVKEETLPEGYIVLKEGVRYSPKEIPIDNELLFYNSIVSTQEYLDKIHEKYRENFIELYGEDLYDKYYTMTESHIYIEKEDEYNDNNDDDDDDDEYY
jgi:hypothetical protein